MLGLLITIALATTTFAMFVLIVASRRWNARIVSAAHVASLRELVDASPLETQSPVEAEPAIAAKSASAPAKTTPRPQRRPRTGDDWNDVVDQLWGQTLEPRP